MKEQIVVFDLDGTAIPHGQINNVDKETIKAIERAQSHGIVLFAATGRRLSYAKPILSELKLLTKCVCANGAQIIDPKTMNVVHKQPINPEDVDSLHKVMTALDYETVVTDGNVITSLTANSSNEEVIAAYVKNVPKKQAIDLANQLNDFEDLVCHVAHPWNGDHENYYAIDVNHKLAAKHHALRKILDEIDENHNHQIIGIGDGGNDMPLLEVADIRVVVKGAPEHVIKIADRIIETPENGGFVDFINELINKS